MEYIKVCAPIIKNLSSTIGGCCTDEDLLGFEEGDLGHPKQGAPIRGGGRRGQGGAARAEEETLGQDGYLFNVFTPVAVN